MNSRSTRQEIEVTFNTGKLCLVMIGALLLIVITSAFFAVYLQNDPISHRTFVRNDVNYFSILGIDPTASALEIRKAYGKLALK